eukprot:39137-Alexandrium_andersonii.AAC.1
MGMVVDAIGGAGDSCGDRGVEDATPAVRATEAVIDGGRDHTAELAEPNGGIALRGEEDARVVHSEVVPQAVHLLHLLAE